MAFKIKDGLRIGSVDVLNNTATTLKLYDGNSNYGSLLTADLTADHTYTLPNTSGTIALAGELRTYDIAAVTDVSGAIIRLSGTNPNSTDDLKLISAGATTVSYTDANTISISSLNYYPTEFTWTGGTTAGPTASLSGTGMSSVSFAAIPAASGTASGVVTTGAQTFAGAKTFSANGEFSLDLAVNGGDITTTASTATVFNTNATTVSIAGAATTATFGYTGSAANTTNLSTGATANATTKIVNIGTGGTAGSITNVNIGSSAGGTVTVNKNLVVSGDLTVDGTTFTVNSTTLSVNDKNIELGSVGTPSDATADGGGITLKGTIDKTFNWINSTDAWTSSEHIDLVANKAYLINGTSVLNSTTLGSAVVNSSLTKIGLSTAGYVKSDVSGNLSASSTLAAADLTGTIPSTVLGNNTVYIGTTSIALNRASDNLALTGISSVTLPGSTSGTVQLIPNAASGTGTVLTLPAITGTVALTSDIKDGTLGAGTSSAGSTNTTVEINFSSTYSANSTNNVTIKNVVGPALSALVTTMTNAGSGFLKKSGVDTYSVDTNTYLTTESDTLQSVTGRGNSTTQAITISNATESTGPTSGALIVSGGVGIAKNLSIQGSIIETTSGGTKVAESNAIQATVATVSTTAIDTWALASFRSCKYIIQVKQGTEYQVSEIMVLHNGVNQTKMTEFAVLETSDTALCSFTTDINSTNVRLLVTMASAVSATINISKTMIVV